VRIFKTRLPYLQGKSPQCQLSKPLYKSALCLTSALDWSGCLTSRPGRFTLGKEIRYPLYRMLGGPHSRSGRAQNTTLTPEFYPWTVQPVASCYTDCGIQAHTMEFCTLLNCFYLSLHIIEGKEQNVSSLWRSWLRHCATSRKVAGSIHNGVVLPAVDSAFSRNEY
jgi:hypothetical protein